MASSSPPPPWPLPAPSAAPLHAPEANRHTQILRKWTGCIDWRHLAAVGGKAPSMTSLRRWKFTVRASSASRRGNRRQQNKKGHVKAESSSTCWSCLCTQTLGMKEEVEGVWCGVVWTPHSAPLTWIPACRLGPFRAQSGRDIALWSLLLLRLVDAPISGRDGGIFGGVEERGQVRLEGVGGMGWVLASTHRRVLWRSDWELSWCDNIPEHHSIITPTPQPLTHQERNQHIDYTMGGSLMQRDNLFDYFFFV